MSTRRGLEAAFGRDAWNARTGEIMARHNAPWPSSQPPDPARLPGG